MVNETNRFEWRRSLAGEHRTGLPMLLFVLLGPPVAWSLHFGVIYFLVALYCTTGKHSVLLEVSIATLVFAAFSALAGVLAFRRWQRLHAGQGWLEAVSGGAGRSTFILIMGVLGAVFFTVLILLEALPPLFVPTCAEVV